MIVGLIGAGNLGKALARGWSDAEAGPDEILLSDLAADRARALADDVGGKAVDSNRELAENVDLIVLCVKPGHLDDVAREIRVTVSERELTVVSVLAATGVAELEQAFGSGIPIIRLMPNVAAEVRMGTFCCVPGSAVDSGVERDVLDLFGLLGEVVRLEERVMDAATALAGCGPAFLALVAEALVDAGVKEGLTARQAADLTVGTMAGTAELLRRRHGDTVSVRRQVASPGGVTAAGLAVLEQRGLRAALDAAVETVARRSREGAPGPPGGGGRA